MARAAYVALDDVIAFVELESEPLVDLTNDEGAIWVVFDDHLVSDWSRYSEYRPGAVTATRVRLNLCLRYFFSVFRFACGNRRLSVEHARVHSLPNLLRGASHGVRAAEKPSLVASQARYSAPPYRNVLLYGYVSRFYVPSLCI